MVHAANIYDGVKAHLHVEHCMGYMARMKKILLDYAYKKEFYDWINDNIIGLEIEFASKPPTGKGFEPVKWRWVIEKIVGWLNLFRRHLKNYENS